ncbi:VWA domain-containing protein [Trueperella pyogenes]|uniref:VWA domain-containing protein n=1 Tax=Trueperella pyogenes TaxID=1661 RepID=UPI00215C3D8E|nr:VWA domain-containing protein [Trueperella pyogenes]UVJ59874.1 VWA domain-containing protein [Trueperella pyogenes]
MLSRVNRLMSAVAVATLAACLAVGALPALSILPNASAANISPTAPATASTASAGSDFTSSTVAAQTEGNVANDSTIAHNKVVLELNKATVVDGVVAIERTEPGKEFLGHGSALVNGGEVSEDAVASAPVLDKRGVRIAVKLPDGWATGDKLELGYKTFGPDAGVDWKTINDGAQVFALRDDVSNTVEVANQPASFTTTATDVNFPSSSKFNNGKCWNGTVGDVYFQAAQDLTATTITIQRTDPLYFLYLPPAGNFNNDTPNIKVIGSSDAAAGSDGMRAEVTVTKVDNKTLNLSIPSGITLKAGDSVKLTNAFSYCPLAKPSASKLKITVDGYTPDKKPTPPDEVGDAPQPENPDTQNGVKAVGTIELGDITEESGPTSKVSAKVMWKANFEKAILRAKAPNSILASELYKVEISQIEDGVTLGQEVKVENGETIVEVYPMKNGRRVQSALVPEGSIISATGTPNGEPFQLDIYGNSIERPYTPPVVVEDNIPYLPDALENPPVKMQCGQNVAVVFDVSRSIARQGLDAVKAAGHTVIDALAGSPAKLGLFNFASESPSIRTAEQAMPLLLSDPASVKTLKEKVNALDLGSTVGTNWEGALRRVKNSGVHYDAVYFVTDGVPSYNDAGTAKDFEGYWTHTTDLDRAIKAANDLKKDGTHIEAIPVLFPPEVEEAPGEYLLKDGVYPTLDHGNKDRWANGSYAVGPGGGHFLRAGIEKYGVQVLDRRMLRVTQQPSLWLDGVLTGTQMLRQLIGPDQFNRDRYSSTPLDSWNKLADTLRKSIASPCVANLTVNKIIKKADGTQTQGVGWEFTAEAFTNNIVTKYDASGNPQQRADRASQKTNDLGRTVFGIGSTSNQKVRVKEEIPAGSGYQLEQQNGFNARCERQVVGTDGSMKKENVPVVNEGPTGFNLDMLYENALGAVRSVECWVVNTEKQQKQTIKIVKLLADGGTTPLAGAQFKLYKADSQGNLTTIGENEVLVQTGADNIHTADLDSPGIYYLIESKAPQGLRLLSEPVKFTATWGSGEPELKILQGASSLIIPGKDSQGALTLQIADIREGQLPRTGGAGVAWLGGIGGLLVLAGLTWAQRKQRA